MKAIKELNMTQGPLARKMIVFVVPIMITSVLQILFNAADMIVVGRFTGSQALAAVGACSSLVSLIVTLLGGISSACNIMVATRYGAGRKNEISQILHTSISVGLIGGAVLCVLGLVSAPYGLLMMGTPEDILDQAVIYLRIYCLSLPGMLVYNYGAATFRAIGDSSRPLYFLIVSGVLNVILNLVFVIVFCLGVAGVAIATTISQYAATIMLLYYLWNADTEYCFRISRLRISFVQLKELLRIGVPAGIQGALFSLSNVVIQTAINSFGSTIIAACSAAANAESIVYVILSAVSQATVSFTAQNAGAGLYKRVRKTVQISIVMVSVIGLMMTLLFGLGSTWILRLYTSDQAVLSAGNYRIAVICMFYLFCGSMDVLAGAMRGLGYSLLPTAVSLMGACGLRILWILTVFQWNPTEKNLYLAYPVSWIATTIADGICLWFIWRRLHNSGNQYEYKGSYI